MAIDLSPLNIFANMRLDSGIELVIPLADFTRQPLSPIEADPVSGDFREILFSILDQYNNYYIGLDTSVRPDRMTIRKTGSLFEDDSMTYTFVVEVTTKISDEDIPDEPTP
jgi:hypothetical protein